MQGRRVPKRKPARAVVKRDLMPCDTFDFRVFSTGVPLNQKNELLLAHLRGDVDFETNLAEYHRRAKCTKPKADPRSVSSSRTLAGQSGNRKRKSEGGQNGDRQRKRDGGQNGDRERKREGGRAGDPEDKRKEGREGGRAGNSENKRKAGRAGNLTQSVAARRRHGHDDDALISPTTGIPGRASVRDRISRAKGMTIRQAIRLKMYITRSLKRDETAGFGFSKQPGLSHFQVFKNSDSVGNRRDKDRGAAACVPFDSTPRLPAVH
jgi:hypothetical protein